MSSAHIYPANCRKSGSRIVFGTLGGTTHRLNNKSKFPDVPVLRVYYSSFFSSTFADSAIQIIRRFLVNRSTEPLRFHLMPQVGPAKVGTSGRAG